MSGLAGLAAAAAVAGPAAGGVGLAVASVAEMAEFHRHLRALELDDIYELIASHLAKAGWRQILSYDPKDPFSEFLTRSDHPLYQHLQLVFTPATIF
eukprot:SAG11_NODE_5949_length_1426_cov_2.093444_2_plen_97_part_00